MGQFFCTILVSFIAITVAVLEQFRDMLVVTSYCSLGVKTSFLTNRVKMYIERCPN